MSSFTPDTDVYPNSSNISFYNPNPRPSHNINNYLNPNTNVRPTHQRSHSASSTNGNLNSMNRRTRKTKRW